mmetsp:Transcript_15530/g.38691  ORF Transcript_15530/g.38691 Transcript_15530/m.38691 type:complete len:216 (-) Transcript_15530:574-1221(-)
MFNLSDDSNRMINHPVLLKWMPPNLLESSRFGKSSINCFIPCSCPSRLFEVAIIQCIVRCCNSHITSISGRPTLSPMDNEAVSIRACRSSNQDAASVRSECGFTFLSNNNGCGVPSNITINMDGDDSMFKPAASRGDADDDMSVDEWMNNCSLAEESNYASGSVSGSVSSRQSFISARITGKKGSEKNQKNCVASAASTVAAAAVAARRTWDLHH